MLRYLIPLGLFLVLVVFLAIGLTRGDGRDKLPSALLNKPAPTFRLPQLGDPAKTFAAEDMRGKVWMMNVWASWCFACRDEHQFLSEYAKTVPIIGFNYKDKPEDALGWLEDLGNPYQLSAADLEGRVAIDYGVYGAPESYLIDKNGIIRFKYVGPVTPDVWSEKFLPLIQELNRQ